tara:strand:- start:2456 stop:3253 length:798 start_codon:yes stop_codon:yes gene_type:complete
MPKQMVDANLFSFTTPTEFVELPSKGQFYPPTHPLHGVDVVEIRHMTAKEEDILTSESLLKKGLVMERLIQSVLVDKTLDPNSLLIGDKNALLIAIRQTGFGDTYSTDITCNACGALNQKDFSLSEKTIKETDMAEDVTMLENGNFLLTVGNIDPPVQMEIRLLTGADEARITKTVENRKKLKQDTGNVTEILRSILVSVNGISDRSVLARIADQMPVLLSRRVRAVYDETMPNVELYGDFTCDSCDHAERLEVPITLGFFWPDL